MRWNKQIEDFRKFCRENKRGLGIIALFLILTYGFLLFQFNFSIDTEELIERQNLFYEGWFGINRYGLVLTKWIFGVLSFVPGYAIVLMLVVTFFYSIVWMYVFYYLNGNRTELYWVFPVIFFTSVPVVELNNFQCQTFEVAVAMLLCAVALLCESRWILGDGNWKDLMLSIALNVWCFGSYQAFVPLYISASLACFILIYRRFGYKDRKNNLGISAKLLGVFVVSFILYNMVGYAVRGILKINQGTYTDNMVQWGRMPIIDIVNILKHYFADIVLARTVFWDYGYLCVGIGFVIYIVLRLKRERESKFACLYYIMVILVFLVSPFLLPFLLGNVPVVRGQLALPFVVAFGLQFLMGYWARIWEKKYVLRIAGIMVFMMIVCRECVAKDNRLLYSDYVVRQQEYMLTTNLISAIHEVDADAGEETPVVIVGKWSAQYNPSMLQGETLGRTFYEWDAEEEGGVEKRVLNYWRCLGYRYSNPSIEQRETAKLKAESMPAWPCEGSVTCEDEMIIIKLSE